MDDRQAILITGAAGFVGRAAAAMLRASGKKLVLLDQVADAGSSGNDANVRVACDISDAAALRRVFEAEEIGGIIHLAAVLPTAASRDPVLATRVNVGGSLNLLEMAREFGVARVVFGSSLSIYGTYPEHEIVSESHRAAPEDIYGAAKLYVEQAGMRYADLYGVEFVSLRIGRVTGPGARSRSSAWRSEIFELLGETKLTKTTIPYVGSERVLLVHVEDVAKALLALMQSSRPAHAVYNAPCESVMVADLKRQIECLNPNIGVSLGEAHATCSPRHVDWSRFHSEFGCGVRPLFEQLGRFVAGPR